MNQILDASKVASYFVSDADFSTFYEVVDDLYKQEINMNKFFTESWAITDAKWKKYLEDLDIVRETTWPSKMEIVVWKPLERFNPYHMEVVETV